MDKRERVLVSACLLGVSCRYDGVGKALPGIEGLLARCEAIPVCPEQLGGLPTPRVPSERRDSRVVNREGADVTEAFRRGAAQALEIARLYGARFAVLKARSPSCGSREIYDGSFTGRTVPGEGITAQTLREAGIAVFDETRLDVLYETLKGKMTDDSLQQ